MNFSKIAFAGFGLVFGFVAAGCAVESGGEQGPTDGTESAVGASKSETESTRVDNGAAKKLEAVMETGEGDMILGRSTAGRDQVETNQRPRLQ